MKRLGSLRDEFETSILELNRLNVMRIFEQVQESKEEINFVNDVIVPVLEKIGQDWEKGDVALSQVYMSGRICEELIEHILKKLSTSHTKDTIPIAIVTLNDFHTLGKTIIYSALRTYGFDLLDYGSGIDEDTLVNKAEKDKIRIILISVLMLPSALKVKNVRERLKMKGLDVKLLVGGAPFRFDDNLWKNVGADAMATSAKEAADIILKWMGELA